MKDSHPEDDPPLAENLHGAPGPIRTDDLLDVNETLYHWATGAKFFYYSSLWINIKYPSIIIPKKVIIIRPQTRQLLFPCDKS